MSDKITYTPTLENYLQYQLYKYSVSKRYRNDKMVLYSFFVLLFLLIFFLLLLKVSVSPFYLIAIAPLALFYRFYFHKIIKRSYFKYLKEHLTDQTKKPVMLEIVKNSLVLRQGSREYKVIISDIQQITEIPACYFIELDMASGYILPKNSAAHKFVRTLTEKYKIKLIQNLRWKW